MNSACQALNAIGCLALFSGCQASWAPAAVDAAVIRAGAAHRSEEHMLQEGRTLFVSRCLECHTLPVISKYSADAWPHLVDKMAKRADLKPAERNALVAYLQAAREAKVGTSRCAIPATRSGHIPVEQHLKPLTLKA